MKDARPRKLSPLTGEVYKNMFYRPSRVAFDLLSLGGTTAVMVAQFDAIWQTDILMGAYLMLGLISLTARTSMWTYKPENCTNCANCAHIHAALLETSTILDLVAIPCSVFVISSLIGLGGLQPYQVAAMTHAIFHCGQFLMDTAECLFIGPVKCTLRKMKTCCAYDYKDLPEYKA